MMERKLCGICTKRYDEHYWNNQGHKWVCSCGEAETYTINFDAVDRTADIHCYGCRGYVHFWDPT